MEHLDQIFEQMQQEYQTIKPELQNRTFNRVLVRLEKKKQQRRSWKALGITASIVTLFMTLMFSKLLPLDRMGGFYSVYFYLSYAFAFMTFIVFIAINNQNFFKKLLGKFLLDKMTLEECEFVFDQKQ